MTYLRKAVLNMSVKQLLQELVDSKDNDFHMTEKQLNIVCAAIELFSEKGFAATSTSEIAKKAGVAEGTIFRHYKTKKDLLLAIPDYVSKLSISKDFMVEIIKISRNPEKGFEDFLRAIIQNRKQFASTNMIIIKCLFQEITYHPDLLDKVTTTIFTPARGKLVEAIDKFKVRGQIVDDIPSGVIVNLIISSIFGVMYTKYIARLDLNWNQTEETEHLIHYIMSGICRNPKPFSLKDNEE